MADPQEASLAAMPFIVAPEASTIVRTLEPELMGGGRVSHDAMGEACHELSRESSHHGCH